jgi:hypothetical protein
LWSVLVPQAKSGNKTIIITRQVDGWTKDKQNPLKNIADRIIVYSGGHTRGASLGPDSEGGKVILNKLV